MPICHRQTPMNWNRRSWPWPIVDIHSFLLPQPFHVSFVPLWDLYLAGVFYPIQIFIPEGVEPSQSLLLDVISYSELLFGHMDIIKGTPKVPWISHILLLSLHCVATNQFFLHNRFNNPANRVVTLFVLIH